MSLLRVESGGLECLAEACQAWSAEVADTGMPASPAGSVQATVAAVNAIHANTGLTGQLLSSRMLATATSLSTAASGYLAREAESATALDGAALDEVAIGR